MARRRRRARPPARITLNLASMIDVTFLLLIYFMVTTVLAPPEDRLSPTIQTRQDQTSSTAPDFQPQVVRVERRDGRPVYVLGSRVLADRAELAQALRGLPRDEGVFIQVFDRLPVEFAVAAVQTARDAGFERVTYVPGE